MPAFVICSAQQFNKFQAWLEPPRTLQLQSPALKSWFHQASSKTHQSKPMKLFCNLAFIYMELPQAIEKLLNQQKESRLLRGSCRSQTEAWKWWGLALNVWQRIVISWGMLHDVIGSSVVCCVVGLKPCIIPLVAVVWKDKNLRVGVPKNQWRSRNQVRFVPPAPPDPQPHLRSKHSASKERIRLKLVTTRKEGWSPPLSTRAPSIHFVSYDIHLPQESRNEHWKYTSRNDHRIK